MKSDNSFINKFIIYLLKRNNFVEYESYYLVKINNVSHVISFDGFSWYLFVKSTGTYRGTNDSIIQKLMAELGYDTF
jgi:hypothetical protein